MQKFVCFLVSLTMLAPHPGLLYAQERQNSTPAIWVEEVLEIIAKARDKADVESKAQFQKLCAEINVVPFSNLPDEDKAFFEDGLLLLGKNVFLNHRMQAIVSELTVYFELKKSQATEEEIRDRVWEGRFGVSLGFLLTMGAQDVASLSQEIETIAERIRLLIVKYKEFLREAEVYERDDPKTYEVFIGNFKKIIANLEESRQYYLAATEHLKSAERKYAAQALRLERFLYLGNHSNVKISEMLLAQAKETCEMASQMATLDF